MQQEQTTTRAGSLSLILAHGVVSFYRIWHGALHLKGAGWLLSRLASSLSGLQAYPLRLKNGNTAMVDFRELSAFGWLNTMLGDDSQEDRLIEVIASHLNEQSIFWDIGANAGILSSELARRIKPAELHYFEPNPRIYPWAESALNHLPQAHGYQIAVSSEQGSATLHIPSNRSAYGSLEGGDGSDTTEVVVPTVPGDTLVYEQGLSAPDIVKIDTEGHEVEVLAGMSRLVREHRPVIFFEHIELSNKQIESICPEGYRIGTICDTSGEILPGFDRHAGHNSVLLPSSP